MTWRTDGLRQSTWDAESKALHKRQNNTHCSGDARHMRAQDDFGIVLCNFCLFISSDLPNALLMIRQTTPYAVCNARCNAMPH